MKMFGLLVSLALVAMVMENSVAAGFDTGPTALDHKALRKRHPIDKDQIAKALQEQVS